MVQLFRLLERSGVKMKKVLIIHYSQSGQLTDIVNNVISDLGPEVELTHFRIEMEEKFPFPWTSEEFYGAFPETFKQEPLALANMDDPNLRGKYDLIIFGYAVWYLSPSIPANSFLKHKVAAGLMENTPVVTVIGCRNMWIQAQEKVKRLRCFLRSILMHLKHGHGVGCALP